MVSLTALAADRFPAKWRSRSVSAAVDVAFGIAARASV